MLLINAFVSGLVLFCFKVFGLEQGTLRSVMSVQRVASSKLRIIFKVATECSCLMSGSSLLCVWYFAQTLNVVSGNHIVPSE